MRGCVYTIGLTAGLMLSACGGSPGSSEDSNETSSGEGSSSSSSSGASSSGEGESSSTAGSESDTGETLPGETDTSSDTSETTDDGGFVPDDDTGGVNPWGCNPGYGECPEGEKCVFYIPEGGFQRREGTKCIPVTGDAAPYEPCELPTGIEADISDTCGAESYCLEVYGTADHGFCAPYNDSSSGGYCDAYPGASWAMENGSSFPDACLHYDCHPEVASTCPEDMRCLFYPAFLYGSMFCWKAPAQDPEPLASACDFGGCGEGQLCLGQEMVPGCAAERCCTQWCNVDTPSCEDPSASCDKFPVWNDGTPEFETLGACVVPGSLQQ